MKDSIMVGSLMKQYGGALVGILSDGMTVDYYHRATDTTLEGVEAYFKSRLQVKDPVGGQTSYQNVPRFRIPAVPWDETTLQGDIVTDKDGVRWEVTNADTSPAGITTLYVSYERKR